MALVETWATQVPAMLAKACKQHKYQVLCLPAVMSAVETGRDLRGVLVLVRADLRIGHIVQECTDFGEYFALVLNNCFCLFVCYRDGARSFSDNLTESMGFFADAAAPLPCLFVGDFNWSMRRPAKVPARIQACTQSPPGSARSIR